MAGLIFYGNVTEKYVIKWPNSKPFLWINIFRNTVILKPFEKTHPSTGVLSSRTWLTRFRQPIKAYLYFMKTGLQITPQKYVIFSMNISSKRLQMLEMKILSVKMKILMIFYHAIRVTISSIVSQQILLMWMFSIFLLLLHDDVIKRRHFPRYWPFVRGIHRPPVNSQHKGQLRGALMFSLICVWINGWVNNRVAGDLRRHGVHYDAIVMVKEVHNLP